MLGQDVEASRVAALNSGVAVGTEADLAQSISAAREQGKIVFSDSLAVPTLQGEPGPRGFIVCVPTPWNDGVGFDAGPLESAIAAIAAVARSGDLLLIRSTVPVGTTRAIASRLAAAGLELDVASAPDRSIEGRSYREQFEVPHLVGGATPAAAARASALLSRLGRVRDAGGAEQSEAAKLLCNVVRDAAFGVANEVAAWCEQRGLDMHAIVAAAGDGYPRFVLPRPGPVGGPCLAKDVMLLLDGLDLSVAPAIRGARAANAAVPLRAAQTIAAFLTDARAPVIAIAGIAYKGHPPVDNSRGSAALDLAAHLRALVPAARLRAWDPEIAPDRIAALDFTAARDAYDLAQGADVYVLANDHAAVAALDLQRLGAGMSPHGLLYDMSGVTAGSQTQPAAGIAFHRIGVGASLP